MTLVWGSSDEQTRPLWTTQSTVSKEGISGVLGAVQPKDGSWWMKERVYLDCPVTAVGCWQLMSIVVCVKSEALAQ